jgi:iron complex outermembrane receptor protein
MKLNKSATGCAFAIAAAIAAPQLARAELEEIVITAQKHAESQQSVPITVSTFTGADLADIGISDTDDLGVATPGLQMNQGGVANLPFMRGIGSQDGTPAQDNPVSTYIDGVLQSSVTGSAFSFNNVERIEVLKGPQGTLFGRNTTGGVINVITKDPSQKPVLNVDLSYGNYRTVSGGLYGSTGITDKLAADLAFYGSNQDKGYSNNLTLGKDVNKREGEFNLRSKWKWTGDSSAATFIMSYSKYSDDMGYVRGVPSVSGLLDFQGLPAPSNKWDVRNDTLNYAHFKNAGFALKLEKSFANFDVLSITAWNKNELDSFTDNDFSGVYYNNAEVDFYERTATQEFQIQSNNKSNLHWIAGVFYLDQSARGKYTIIGTQLSGPGINTLQLNGHIDSQSIAGFGEVAYNFTDKTRLTVGARVTQDERKFDGNNVIMFGALANPNEGFFDDPNGFLVTVPIPQGPKGKWTEPTYRAVIDHKITDDVMVYGSYNRGFRSGNFITAVGTDGVTPQKPFNPEFINAFEIGVKSELLERRLRVNAALYHYKVKDLQFQILQGVSTVTQNAAAATIKGAELAVTWQATHDLTLDLGSSFIDGHYSDFPNAITNIPVAPGVNAPSVFNASGKQIGGSAKFTASGAATYKKQMPSGEYSLAARVSYNDGYPWEPDGRLVQNSYSIVNLTLGWRAPGDKWGVRLTGKNLGNEYYAVTERSVSGQGDFQASGSPRTYSLNVDYKFF